MSNPSDPLTKTPSADHDAGNLRGLAEPNHYQPHALSQGWRDDMENAPRDREILLGAPGRSTEGYWYVPEGKYLGDCGGECRCPEYGEPDEEPGWFSADGGFTKENPPTHWMPLPAPPVPEHTPRDSSESTTGGAAPDHTTMEARGR